MNRQELQDLSHLRVREAKLLLDAGSYVWEPPTGGCHARGRLAVNQQSVIRGTTGSRYTAGS